MLSRAAGVTPHQQRQTAHAQEDHSAMHGTMIITATSTPTTPACEAARRGAAARRGGGRGHGRGVGRAKPPRTQGRCVVASALACGSCALCRRGVERSGGRAGRGSREGCGERAASERSRTVSKWFGHRVDRQEMRAKTEGGKKTNTGMPPRPHHVAVRHRLQRPALPHTPQQHATRPAGSAYATTLPTTPACKATRGCGGVERHRAHIGQGGRNPAAGCRNGGACSVTAAPIAPASGTARSYV